MRTHEEFEALAALDALGAATTDEQRELQSHVENCEPCQRAHNEFEQTAAALGGSFEPVTPPKEVKISIMETISEPQEDGTETIIQRRNFDATRWWLATAATLFFALWGWRELAIRAEHEKIASRDAEIQSLTAANTLISQRADKLNAEIAALAAKDTRMIALTGQTFAPAASARVFLDPARRRALVLFANLPANAGDKSYQLWIIRADQAQPQSAGVFDASPSGTATISVENLPVDKEIKAMAVTLEPKGGGQQPTNTNYVVMGKS